MTARIGMAAVAGCVAVVLAAYSAGAVSTLRRHAGIPDRDEISQWWIHRGAQTAPHFARPPLVFLIVGQSNAGNYGRGSRQRADDRVYNIFKGHLYHAQDPLLGSDGLGISPWIPFSQELLKRGSAQSVVLALAVRGGTGVRAWAEGGPMRSEVLDRVGDLRAFHLSPDFVLWQQGENDAPPYRTDPADYANTVRGLVSSLRQAGVQAPVLIAQATLNRYFPSSAPLRQAQAGLSDPAGNIGRGPDVDRLGPQFRYDGLHFSETGIAALSRLWLNAVDAAQDHREIPHTSRLFNDNHDHPSY